MLIVPPVVDKRDRRSFAELTRQFFGKPLSMGEAWELVEAVEVEPPADSAAVSSDAVWIGSVGYERHKDNRDFARMLAPLGARGGTLTAHIRGEGDGLVESVREVVSIAERVGCRLEISHFKACGLKNWRSAIHRAIGEIESARARGLDVACDF